MSAPAIGLRPRFSPGPDAEVDWSHPLAQGLLALHIPLVDQAIDLVGNANMTRSGSPSRGSGAFGEGQYGGGALAGSEYTLPTDSRLRINAPYSIMWAGHHVSTPTAAVPLYGVVHNRTDASPYLCYALSVQPQLTLYQNRGGGLAQTVAASSATLGAHVYVGTNDLSGNVYVYDNGALAASNTIGGGSSISYGSTSLISFGVQPATSRQTNSTSNIGAVWNRMLSANEVAQLAADPFCMLRY